MADMLLAVHSAVWGIPMLLLILGVGLRITVMTGCIQIRLFPGALKHFIQQFRGRCNCHGVSPFQALCTALGATAGTGNIIGVAGAICLGGPGAVFWMWICGLVAMATKFAEATLAVRYRRENTSDILAGPMYMIVDGMGNRWKPLAVAYAVLGILASFGVGNAAQVNALVSGIANVVGRNGRILTFRQEFAVGLILCVAVGSVILGGVKRIGSTAEILVPVVSVLYMGLCLTVLVIRRDALGNAVSSIISGAFSPAAVTGGAVGSLFRSLQIGCCRGVFTNEAGMGTAAMAHGSAEVDCGAEQGMMGILEVFLDTILMCTLTALVILVSGVSIPYGMDGGGFLTTDAFSAVLGNWASLALTASLCCFGLATVLGWGLYGTRCAQFLFGEKSAAVYALFQTLAVLPGAILKTETVWLLSELFNGLMAIPNLIVLAALTPEVCRLTKDYIKKEGGAAAEGGNHADFH